MSRLGILRWNARLFLPELAKLPVSFDTGSEFRVSNKTENSKPKGLGLTLKPKLTTAAADQDDPDQAFFVAEDGKIKDFAGSITSFLCTDQACDIVDEGGKKLDTLALRFPDSRLPDKGPDAESVLTN